jgi:hypothetical protein
MSRPARGKLDPDRPVEPRLPAAEVAFADRWGKPPV